MRLYLLVSTVLAFLCTAFLPVNAQSRSSADCPEINVKAEIIHTRNGGENGEIVLKFETSSNSDQYLILLTCPGCQQPRKAVDNAFKNLRAGHYDIYVVDKQGCSRQLNIQVN